MLDGRHLEKLGMRLSRLRGFTLIELMITIAVMAILLGVAVPSFKDAVLSMKLSSFANNLVSSVYTARSEAIKRNAVITLCASADGTSCATSGGWEQGWIVMCNTNDNLTCNAAGTSTLVIHKQSGASTGFLITGMTAPGSGTIVRSLPFQPSGVSASQATITVCRATPVGKTERVVTISATGRPSTKKTTDGVCT